MDELLSLEKQIYTVVQKSDELVEENNDLREEIENLISRLDYHLRS